jgi:hypothetical protein
LATDKSRCAQQPRSDCSLSQKNTSEKTTPACDSSNRTFTARLRHTHVEVA